MAAPRPKFLQLEDLPDDIHREILIRIPCGADRAPLSLASRKWRDLVRLLKGDPPPLPWLLLPTAHAPDGSELPHRISCILAGCGVHHHLSVDPPGARFFGSHDGAWLLAHYRDGEARGNRAVNVRTGLVENLPAGFLGMDGERFDDMVILAAALSSPPDDASCVAAAIVVVELGAALRLRCVALWRRGWEMAIEPGLPQADAVAVSMEVDDLIFHRGAFHMVTQGNHIRVCTPVFRQEDAGLMVHWDKRLFQPVRGIYGQNVLGRYLAVSHGDLLLVLRFTPEADQPTSSFKVFKETATDAADADFSVAQYPWAWKELDTLGGRILFVGQGCSRCYDVPEYHYPRFKDSVYFIDDSKFYDMRVLFGIGNDYPCSDNGKWSEGHVKRCFPQPPQPSDHSSPAWIFP